MPIAASTDSSARAPWSTPRPASRPRLASSIRALATASGLRSSCATKLANRDRRRRSSTSLPTSRSSRTAPPSGRGVPSTSTSRSRPDIGSRTRTRLLQGSRIVPAAVATRRAAAAFPFVARLGDARPLVQRPVEEAPPEDAQGGVVGEGAQPIRHRRRSAAPGSPAPPRPAARARDRPAPGRRAPAAGRHRPPAWPGWRVPRAALLACRAARSARCCHSDRRPSTITTGEPKAKTMRRTHVRLGHGLAGRRQRCDQQDHARHHVGDERRDGSQAQADEGDDQHDQDDVRRRLGGARCQPQ